MRATFFAGRGKKFDASFLTLFDAFFLRHSYSHSLSFSLHFFVLLFVPDPSLRGSVLSFSFLKLTLAFAVGFACSFLLWQYSILVKSHHFF